MRSRRRVPDPRGRTAPSATALQPPPHLLTTLRAPAGGGRCGSHGPAGHGRRPRGDAEPESSGSYRAFGGRLQGCPSGGRSRRVPLSSTPAAGRLTPPAGRAPADLARRGPTERRTVLRRLKARMAQRGAPRPHLPDRERRRRVRTRQTRADRPLRRERRRPLWNSPRRSASTSASAQIRSVVVVAGRMVRV